jgi:hypothetical protein
MYFHLLILSLSCSAIWFLLKKSLPMPIASSIFPALSCTSFRVSGHIFRSLVHFELILVQGERHGASISFLQAAIQFFQQYLLKRLSFLHPIFLVTLSKIRREGVVAWIHNWVLYSVPLVFISVFVPIPHCSYCYGSVL